MFTFQHQSYRSQHALFVLLKENYFSTDEVQKFDKAMEG